jgi:hypothetical protein
MITIENFPLKWDEVKLETGRKIFCIPTTGYTETEYIEQVIDCFDIDLSNLKLDELAELKNKCLLLLASDPNVKELDDEILIRGKRFRLIKDFTKLNYNQFLDIELILSQAENNNVWDVMNKLLAILYVEQNPRRWKFSGKIEFDPIPYNPSVIETNGKLFDQALTVTDVFKFSSIFFYYALTYSQTLLFSLQNQVKVNQQ